MDIRYKIFILPALLATLATSCALEEKGKVQEDFTMRLTTAVNGSYESGTRVDLKNAESDIRDKSIYVYSWNEDKPGLSGDEATYASGSWKTTTPYKLKKDEDYTFFAYSNLPEEGVSTPDCTKDSIAIEVTDITKAQEDILLGYEGITAASSGDVDMSLSHPFASVKVVLGEIAGLTEATEVTLSGLVSGGNTALKTTSSKDGNDVMQYEWWGLGSAEAQLTETGLSVSSGELATFVVIPQDLSTSNALLKVKYNKGVLTKILTSDIWKAGYTTTYTIGFVDNVSVSMNTSLDGRIISNVSFVNECLNRVYMRASISGAWYDASGNIVAPWDNTTGFVGLPGTNWTKSGENYYYTQAVAPEGGSPSALFTSYTRPDAPVTGAHLELKIMVQAIPYNTNKTCIEAFSTL